MCRHLFSQKSRSLGCAKHDSAPHTFSNTRSQRISERAKSHLCCRATHRSSVFDNPWHSIEAMKFQIFHQPVESIEHKTLYLSISTIEEAISLFCRTQFKRVTKVGLAILVVSLSYTKASRPSITLWEINSVRITFISSNPTSTFVWVDFTQKLDRIQLVVSKDKECNEHLIECPSRTRATRWLEF